MTLRSVLDRMANVLSAIGDTALLPGEAAEAGADGAMPVAPNIINTLSATLYGCHPLQRADRDESDPVNAARPRIWGGQENAPVSICPDTGEPVADETIPHHVLDLQNDLRELGFLLVGTPDGGFGRLSQQAVREFQIYAGMERVARVQPGAAADLQVPAGDAVALGANPGETQSRYLGSLEAVANNVRYTGPISGVANADTRRAISHWKTNRWRCPVVVEAWTVSGGNRSSLFQRTDGTYAVNLWHKDDLKSTAPRVYYRDFTGYYSYPAGHNADDMHTLGEWDDYSSWSGPVSLPPRHTWDEAEILPDNFVGVAAGSLSASQTSTYRAVRAAAEVECIGFYDCVNSYDNAVVSVGPCHWILCNINTSGVANPGEMPAFLAYFRYAHAVDFTAMIERFGTRPHELWTNAAGVASGGDLFSTTQRKYHSTMAWQDDTGAFVQVPAVDSDYDYYRNWHWFFRWVMVGRVNDGYHRSMWDMARIRLRDIRDTPWGQSIGAHAGLTIGDVFTSERACSILQRWHIRYPVDMTSGGNAGSRLRGTSTITGAFARAQNETASEAGGGNTAGSTLDWTTNPSTWTDNHEAALIRGLLAEAAVRSTGLSDSVQRVYNWPAWLTGSNSRGFNLAAPVAARLSATRGSFDFYDTGLPPAP